MMKIYVADRETGNIIDEFVSIAEARNAIAQFEEIDKAEGIYEPNFYDIIDEKYMSLGE